MGVGRPSNAEVAQQLEMAKIAQLPDGPADIEGLDPAAAPHPGFIWR